MRIAMLCRGLVLLKGLLVINERVELSAVLKVTSRVTAGLSVSDTDVEFFTAAEAAETKTPAQINKYTISV